MQADKATVFITRSFNLMGVAMPMQVYIDDKEVTTVMVNGKYSQEVSAPATVRVAVGTMGKRSAPENVDVQPGKSYYLKTKIGAWGPLPVVLSQEEGEKIFKKK
jgi:hypothetical protein